MISETNLSVYSSCTLYNPQNNESYVLYSIKYVFIHLAMIPLKLMTAETFFQVKLKFSEHGMGLKLPADQCLTI